MLRKREYKSMTNLDVEKVSFSLQTDRHGKPDIRLKGEVAFLSPPAITQYPRCTGDGNLGTLYGPTDPKKAKFTLDLCDLPIKDDQPNADFALLAEKLNKLDDKLLEFVHKNQQKILNKSGLTKEQVSMLQNRAVKVKLDKDSGERVCAMVQLSMPKYVWDGSGRVERQTPILDYQGALIEGGQVSSGDLVAASVFVNSVYNGIAGDKFGIQYAFEHVCIVCQRSKMPQKENVSLFANQNYNFATEYDPNF